jgi:hypothetical protein
MALIDVAPSPETAEEVQAAIAEICKARPRIVVNRRLADTGILQYEVADGNPLTSLLSTLNVPYEQH